MSVTPEQAAAELADGVPLIMRTIIGHMRAHRDADVSEPQFRALAFIHHHSPCSLSQLAEHWGMSLPTGSKLIDGLVARELVSRQAHPLDRRRLILTLTPAGKAVWERARASTQAALAKTLAGCTEEQRVIVFEAMQILRPAFRPEPHANGRPGTSRTGSAPPAPHGPREAAD